MIDRACKPWLLEVNHAPSFATESGFDQHLKTKLIENTFLLLNLSPEKKSQFHWNQRLQLQKRILTGKIQRLSVEEKEQKRKEYDEKRNRMEQRLLGNYRMIYPNPDMELVKVLKYERCQEASRDLFEYFTMGKKKKEYPWKSIKEAEQLKAEKLPPWRRTGGQDPLTQKQSKYQQNSQIKARVYTGLHNHPKQQSITRKDQLAQVDEAP